MMSIEDTVGDLDEGETGVVCGKALNPGHVLARVHQGDSKLLTVSGDLP